MIEIKKLVKNRIIEIYNDYKKESEPKRFENDDYLLDRYVLKVLVDIYKYDETDRLIYQSWDLIEREIEDILKNEKNERI